MNFVTFLLFYGALEAFTQAATNNVTKFNRKNALLYRSKRFLRFPKGSNFVINLTCTKPLLRIQPTGWNTVYEMDFPFALPEDPYSYFKRKKAGRMEKRHVVERRDLIANLEEMFSLNGLDGSSCIKRFLCESEKYVLFSKKTSMMRQLTDLLFRSIMDNDVEFPEYKNACEVANFEVCPVSLYELLLSGMSQ